MLFYLDCLNNELFPLSIVQIKGLNFDTNGQFLHCWKWENVDGMDRFLSLQWNRLASNCHGQFMPFSYIFPLQGLGTDEDTLIEIICTRTNKELMAIKEKYHSCKLNNRMTYCYHSGWELFSWWKWGISEQKGMIFSQGYVYFRWNLKAYGGGFRRLFKKRRFTTLLHFFCGPIACFLASTVSQILKLLFKNMITVGIISVDYWLYFCKIRRKKSDHQ
jgi:hypothetical protein